MFVLIRRHWRARVLHREVVTQIDLARRLPWTPLPFSSSSSCFLLSAAASTAEAAGTKLKGVASWPFIAWHGWLR